MTNTDLLERWIEALRSDEYKQGDGRLRTVMLSDDRPDEFCCLGVLCDISGVGKWEEAEYIFRLEDFSDVALEADLANIDGTIFHFGIEELDRPIGDFIDPDESDGVIWVKRNLEDVFSPSLDIKPTERLHHALVRINDNGYGFDVIAGVLEKVLEKVTNE